MIEEPNPYDPKYRIQSHGYEAYAWDLRAWGEAMKARVAELEALIGTIRMITGCPILRNVRDIGVEQHSREIAEAIRNIPF